MIKKVLIANRGEVTARVARTCKRLGMTAVAVFNDLDEDSVHRQACDESIHIGPANLRDSYLNHEALLRAAKAAQCDAVHPGYGLLSESVPFCEEVVRAGLTFIGPAPDVLSRSLDRLALKQVALDVGVRVLDSSDEPVVDLAQAREQAAQIGFPVAVKPVHSGGGIGPTQVEDEDALEQALSQARERATDRFGDDRVYLERVLDRPRHLEVQVISDGAGCVVALGDRECSIQRHGLRLLDESPAPSLQGGEQGRRIQEAIWDAAVRIVKALGLPGASTVEFLLDADARAYFLEVRPRLQVAHGTTEMCTNTDLVEAQLCVAQGKPLPSEMLRALPSGHAMELRISLDPGVRLGPQPIEVKEVRWPNASPGRLRIESSIHPGTRFTEQHDVLLAKITSFAPTRHAALLLLDRVLAECSLSPLPTNAALLRRILGHESFRAGQYDASFFHAISRK